jgi:hypothetical protein
MYMVLNKILGNFATRTKFARQIIFNKANYAADGQFVEEYISKFCKEPNSIKKINQALYVHN